MFFDTKTCRVCGHRFKASTGKKIREEIDMLMMGTAVETSWFCKEHAPKYDYIIDGRFYRDAVRVAANGGFEH